MNAMKVDHAEWLRKRGLLPSQIRERKTKNPNWKREYSESLKVDRSTSGYESSGLKGISPCSNHSVMANLHKETKEVQKAILEKASRTAPLWNKGGYQVITDGTDLTDIGKKK